MAKGRKERQEEKKNKKKKRGGGCWVKRTREERGAEAERKRELEQRKVWR